MFSLSSLNKYAPFAAIAGYAMVYNTKGWDRIMTDLTSITVDKLQAKWQNIAIAGGAAIATYLIKGVRLPPTLKTVIVVALWFVAGYNIAVAVDPPAITYTGRVGYVPPTTYNKYALAGV